MAVTALEFPINYYFFRDGELVIKWTTWLHYSFNIRYVDKDKQLILHYRYSTGNLLVAPQKTLPQVSFLHRKKGDCIGYNPHLNEKAKGLLKLKACHLFPCS